MEFTFCQLWTEFCSATGGAFILAMQVSAAVGQNSVTHILCVYSSFGTLYNCLFLGDNFIIWMF
jgi:hypothetical protein